MNVSLLDESIMNISRRDIVDTGANQNKAAVITPHQMK